MVGLGSALQQVVPQGLVLTRLELTRLLELTLYLQLLRLGQKRTELILHCKDRRLIFTLAYQYCPFWRRIKVSCKYHICN